MNQYPEEGGALMPILMSFAVALMLLFSCVYPEVIAEPVDEPIIMIDCHDGTKFVPCDSLSARDSAAVERR